MGREIDRPEEPEKPEPLIEAREVHAYGGLVLLVIGGEVIHFGLGLAAAGLVLLYMGIWRMG